MEDCLLKWFQQHRAEDIPISGRMLYEKSTELAAHRGMEYFSASSGWLNKFKVRNGVDPETVRDWKQTYISICTERHF